MPISSGYCWCSCFWTTCRDLFDQGEMHSQGCLIVWEDYQSLFGLMSIKTVHSLTNKLAFLLPWFCCVWKLEQLHIHARVGVYYSKSCWSVTGITQIPPSIAGCVALAELFLGCDFIWFCVIFIYCTWKYWLFLQLSFYILLYNQAVLELYLHFQLVDLLHSCSF